MKNFTLEFNNLSVDLNVYCCEGLQDECQIQKTDNGYIVCRTVTNQGEKKVNLSGLGYVLSGIDFSCFPDDDYFYCNENARIYNNLTLPIDYNRQNDNAEENKKFGLKIDSTYCDPEVKNGDICSSPYQPFPAILLSNYNTNIGLVVGALSQKVFCQGYEVYHENGKITIKINSSFKAIAYRELKPKETLIDQFFIGQTNRANDINGIFDCYSSVLRSVLTDNLGSGEANRHNILWDSWNDGISRSVSEQMLLEEAKAVKKYFPILKWFQLDDGYASLNTECPNTDAHGLGVPYEGEEGIDKNKFPNGLRIYSDKIREIGLIPAIWIGGLCPKKTKIYNDHPDWFIDYDYRIPTSAPLDVSIKEVRDYLEFATDKFLLEYGFDGVKHDFWSYAFEDRHDLLKNKDRSGFEYRDWWLKLLSKNKTYDGYLETCCDLSLGNPFIGQYANNYRFGIDIGKGKWHQIKTVMFWMVSVLSPQTGDLFIPNSDSIGMLPGLSDNDFMFTVNLQVITRTLVELSGKFSKIEKDNPRLKVLQRALKYLNNGEKVYFAKYDYRKKGENLPEIIYINSAFDEPNGDYSTVAIFNPEEVEKTIEFKYSDIGLSNKSHQVEFVWEEKFTDLTDLSFTLAPHQSVLLKIKK